MRGKLDVPKERFITYPHCNRDADRTPVIGWAGWDPLQQAQAVAGYYERMATASEDGEKGGPGEGQLVLNEISKFIK